MGSQAIPLSPFRPAQIAKVLPAIPPTNKDFRCVEFATPDGTYRLQHEIAEPIVPQYNIGTRVSISCRRADESLPAVHAIKTPSTVSSVSETLAPTLSSSDKANGDSSDEDSLHVAPPYCHDNQAQSPLVHTLSSLASPLQPQSQSPLHQPLQPPHHKPQILESVPEDYGGSSTSSFSSLFGRNHQRHGSLKRPKHSLAKTKSNFIVRIILHDLLSKIVSAKAVDESFMFYNLGSSFIWTDADGKIKKPLSRIDFSKDYPTCNDVNTVTRSNHQLDVIIGFSSGDFVWCDPIGNKYCRINKGGIMNDSSVTMVKWVPGSEDRWMASFNDGSILLLDKDRDDQSFAGPKYNEAQGFHASRFHKTRHNPVSYWSISDKSITAFAFSPNGAHVATVGHDGILRIIEFKTERLQDVFGGYYGRLQCVAWSPDGKYILTGGQDDLVTIWSFVEKRIIARCQGHRSWVTAVAFDPWRCDDKVYRFGSVGEDCRLLLWDFSFGALHRPKQLKTSYPNGLPSPKETQISSYASKFEKMIRAPPMPQSTREQPPKTTTSLPSLGRAGSLSNGTPFSRFRRRSSRGPGTLGPVATERPVVADEPLVSIPIVHPVLTKTQVSVLQPVCSQKIHADPCVDLHFRKSTVVTSDRRGCIRTWGRP
ncbi:WD40-repeat-containing domain protein [Phycomyces nitens]|nr:WD40-repeat-containing domain protein [Phycomyces nitens]